MDRRFRCSIYVDIFIPPVCKHCGESSKFWDIPPGCSNLGGHELCNIEDDRSKAREEVEDINNGIPNSYVGGVATMDEIINGKANI